MSHHNFGFLLKNNFGETGFLTMDPVTMAPIQMKMIEPSLLTEAQVRGGGGGGEGGGGV